MIDETNDSLKHVGVLGMHWGHHKRVEPVEVKRARELVNKNKQTLNVKKKKLSKESLHGLVNASKKTQKEADRASLEYDYAKQDLSNVKILNHLKTKTKSKSQLSMEERYKKQGMNNDEAAVAAYKHIRTKKILTGVGAVALLAGGAYVAYKIRDSRVDKIIKSGTLLQNVSSDDNAGIRDAFYSSKNKLDNIKYKGLYGDTLKQKGDAFKKEIKVLSDIKQASPKNAKDTLEELIKSDPEFSDDLKKYIKLNKLGGVYSKKSNVATAGLVKGVVNKDTYEVFNASLVDHSPEMQKLTDRYFNELSKKGYNALRDVNDSKYSGYKSINPIIAFNSSGKVDVVDVKKLTDNEIAKAKDIGYAHILGTDLIKKGAAMVSVIVGTTTLMDARIASMDTEKINNYRKKHPESKLTNTEIIRMIERSKVN
jgi:hypothetical protein